VLPRWSDWPELQQRHDKRYSGDACGLRECPTGQIWWVGGLQWGTELVRDADASGETKALACKPVDAKIITLESYDEYGYRYEYE